MYQIQTVSISCRKLLITALAITSLFFSNASFANNGITGGSTLVLEPGQYPASLKKYNATEIYILYWGTLFTSKALQGTVLRKDTIINYKKFVESFPNTTGYRFIYSTNSIIDSVLQLDAKFQLRNKAYNLGDGMLHIIAFDSTQKKQDEFIYNYDEKFTITGNTRGKSVLDGIRSLDWILRQYVLYSTYDRNNYARGAVWILSIGIDDYGPTQYRTCKKDAQSYTEFFKKQFAGGKLSASFFHEYILLDKDATREAILAALKDIAGKASFNDYFIFNFSGCSNVIKNDPENGGTYFFPYDVMVTSQSTEFMGIKLRTGTKGDANRNSSDILNTYKKCIPLKILQEHFQSIPANNQLFISEAGPSGKFKTEFIKTLMQNSPQVASILNKNRIIIVPNGIGYDGFKCQETFIQNGPLNYFITALDSANIYDIFKEEYYANQVSFRIRNKAYNCRSFDFEYFDIFFERKFLKEYKEIFDDAAGQTRGLGLKTKELRSAANFSGKQYALVIGTNNYKGAGWKKLPNAINDARAVADMLAQGYGFEVQLLEDKPMDSIYKSIAGYYRNLQPNDQLVIYFAGHGDMEDEFMDDGFIVCADSRSRDDDPARNTYIQYVKLQKMINRIPARQILVMLDVCHGGAFNQKRSDPGKTIANRNVRQFLVDQSQYTCRKFLSSVGTEEAFDGKPGDHSPFAKLLLQVLNAKGKETNGIITLSDIFSVLQISSMNETATLKISPQKDGFGSDNPQSDFILIPVDKEQAKQ
ncbi:MAG: caspase family protein [Ferruginibacter sp.]